MALTVEEEDWVKAAEAADEGRGIELRFVSLNNESEMQEAFDALAIKGIGPKSRFRKFIRQLQTELKPAEEQRCWYMVSGSIIRPNTHAGARYELFKLASLDGFTQKD